MPIASPVDQAVAVDVAFLAMMKLRVPPRSGLPSSSLIASNLFFNFT